MCPSTKRQIPAGDLMVGDRLCFAQPRYDVRVERLSNAKCEGAIGIHSDTESRHLWLKAADRVSVERTEEQWIAADIAINAMKNKGRLLEDAIHRAHMVELNTGVLA